MADNAIVKILTALLKYQVKKVVGDEALGAIGQEIAAIGGEKVDEQIKSWLGEETNAEELENVARYARKCFQDKVEDYKLVQWMVSLPLGDLPKVVEAVENLPKSPDEKELEKALRESISNSWQKLSPEQVDNAVSAFLACLRSALLPIQKQTLMVIGRSVLRTEDKVDLLLRWFEQYIIKGLTVPVEELDEGLSDYWNLKHPYPMSPNFTGRLGERKMLVDWLENDGKHPLFILRALGGFGKSALAWHWLTHDVNAKSWSKVIWWSFYEGDSSFENFIRETLEYLKVEVPPGQRQQVDTLLEAMGAQNILLIMDGFERALRLYVNMNAAYQGDEEQKIEDAQRDCVNINAEIFLRNLCVLPNIKGKVLMTTRLLPRAVEERGELLDGCHEEELQAMQKEDAVTFFRAQGIRGARAEIEAACDPYGYHPLSLRILAGLIANDREDPGDIAVARKLDITDDVIANKHHVLEVAYNTLTQEQQRLLSHIACFRSATIYEALKEISDKNIDANLTTLENRGLLHWDRNSNKYDLHPIVRHYAYDRLTAPDRTNTHIRLLNYFSNIPIPEQARTVQELSPVIEIFHHCVHAGRYSEALTVFRSRLNRPLYVEGGEYILCTRLLESLVMEDEESLFPNNPHAQPWLLNKLALCYNRIGRSREAELFFKKQIVLRENMGYSAGVAIGLGNLSEALIRIGHLKEGTDVLERKIKVSEKIGDQAKEMAGRQDYGLVLAYRAEFTESEKQLKTTIDWLSKESRSREEGVSWAFYTLLKILQGNLDEAVASAISANRLASVEERKRDVIRAKWLLGLANTLKDASPEAESYLETALVESRRINLVELEPDILLAQARWHYAHNNIQEVQIHITDALSIANRCEYRLKQAEIYNFLAQFALEQEKNRAKAKELAEKAKELAHCDGPPYYYKVAYEEAERFLEKLNKE